MSGKSCVVVLIGSATAGRKFIDYEIEQAWRRGKGLVGVNVHGLKDLLGRTSLPGANPFAGVTVDGVNLGPLVSRRRPPAGPSTDVYAYIRANLGQWVDEAVADR